MEVRWDHQAGTVWNPPPSIPQPLPLAGHYLRVFLGWQSGPCRQACPGPERQVLRWGQSLCVQEHAAGGLSGRALGTIDNSIV